MDRVKIITFYLPQFHPIKENNEWWGPGFTEWTNVTKAKPWFKGHHQPNLPADLGFYDLRLAEAREGQSQLALKYGVDVFCYWHYWFGGKRILERPFNEVLALKKPDISFCLSWANISWKGVWYGGSKQTLIEQTYGGKEDYTRHFYELVRAFQDERYLKVDGKPVFLIYKPKLIPDLNLFLDTWNELAVSEGLPGIYFIGMDLPKGTSASQYGLDSYTSFSIYFNEIMPSNLLSKLSNKLLKKNTDFLRHQIFNEPYRYPYDRYLDWVLRRSYSSDEFPVVVPNWDNTPRSGTKGYILEHSTPEKFEKVLESTVEKIISRKHKFDFLFIKSWNEWAEGNYLEPDQRYGMKYLEKVKLAKQKLQQVN